MGMEIAGTIYEHGCDQGGVLIVAPQGKTRGGKHVGYKRKACDFCSEEYVELVVESRDHVDQEINGGGYGEDVNFFCTRCSWNFESMSHIDNWQFGAYMIAMLSDARRKRIDNLDPYKKMLMKDLPYDMQKLVGLFLPIDDYNFMDLFFHFMLKYNNRRTHRYYCHMLELITIDQQGVGRRGTLSLEREYEHMEVLLIPVLRKMMRSSILKDEEEMAKEEQAFAERGNDIDKGYIKEMLSQRSISSSCIHLFFGRVFNKWTFNNKYMYMLSNDMQCSSNISRFQNTTVLLLFADVFRWSTKVLYLMDVDPFFVLRLFELPSVRDTVNKISYLGWLHNIGSYDARMFFRCKNLRNLKLRNTESINDAFLKDLATSCPELSKFEIVTEMGYISMMYGSHEHYVIPNQDLNYSIDRFIFFTVKGAIDYFVNVKNLTSYVFQTYNMYNSNSIMVRHMNRCAICHRLFFNLVDDVHEIQRRLKQCLSASHERARAIEQIKISIYNVRRNDADAGLQESEYHLIDEDILTQLLKIESIKTLELHHGEGVGSVSGLETLLRIICEKQVETLVLVDFKHIDIAFIKRIQSRTLKIVQIFNSGIQVSKDEFAYLGHITRNAAMREKSVIEVIRNNLPQLTRFDFSIMRTKRNVHPHQSESDSDQMQHDSNNDDYDNNLLFDSVVPRDFNNKFCKFGFRLHRFDHSKVYSGAFSPEEVIFHRMRLEKWGYYSLVQVVKRGSTKKI